MPPWTWPSSTYALELSIEELGLSVLSRLAATDWRALQQRPLRTGQIVTWVAEWDRIEGYVRQSQTELIEARRDLCEALAEAWEWLRVEGLLAQAVVPNANPDAFFVTRRGVEILAEEDPLGILRARRRLGVELHPLIAPRLQPMVRAGAFEQAALDALRQVEVRVRELAEEPRDERGQPYTGVALMQHAFGERGKLTDPEADAGEQRGMRELFAGAFGAVHNPLGHRSVEWTEPTQAAEMVLFADLLMRQLDRVAERAAAEKSRGGRSSRT